MHITSLRLQNFKRFTDLTIQGIPADTKLVLLIGANGSGKSSVFDAFYACKKNFGHFIDESYFRKLNETFYIDIDFAGGRRLSNHEGEIFPVPNLRFFGRSSNRIIPRISLESSPEKITDDSDRPPTFIDSDTRLENDVFAYMQRLDDAIREPVFSGRQVNVVQIFQELIEPFNSSLRNIFGHDLTTTIQVVRYQNPRSGVPGQLIFKKGIVEINYDTLSHGEKQVVTLLLNFIVRKYYYEDAIIFIDEMDAHLNTALQIALMEEIVTKWIPDSSQFWTASHALGFIDYALGSSNAVILDFDALDFDKPQVLEPKSKDRLDVYEVAVPKAKLFHILSGKRIVVCENQNDEYYNLLNLPDTVFVGVRDARDVFLHVKRDNRYYALRDRDFLSDSEIASIQKKYPHHRILRYYDFENYLYHPDNIAEVSPEGYNAEAYRAEILRQKRERKDYILVKLGQSRQNYEEFKTDEKLRDKTTDSIVDDFTSDDFERYYKYFDMKDEFKKQLLAPFNITRAQLVATEWFRNAIESVLND